MDQWNRIDCPEINSHVHNLSSTRVLRIQKGERVVSSTNNARKTKYPHAEEGNWTFFLHMHKHLHKMD